MTPIQSSIDSAKSSIPKLDYPHDHELEIAVLGTGGGYGESIVVHLGERVWVVVDSCIDPTLKSILPIQYLERIGVDIGNDVKLILCTHWHDDHIRGISQLFERASNAAFAMARVNDLKKFLYFAGLDHEKIKSHESLSSTREFNRCIDILTDRRQTPKYAGLDRVLFSSSVGKLNSELFSLSPSDKSVEQFDSEISTLITNFGESRKKVIAQSPNDKSVVLLIKFGNHRAILGADLEVTNSAETGWLNIIRDSQAIDNTSSYFKIPHHGSENGYHTEIWAKLLTVNPLSTMTPWNKRDYLPTAKMVETYKKHSDQLFITSPPIKDKGSAKKRDKQIGKIMDNLGYNVKEVKYHRGIIRARIKKESPNWEIDTFDSAIKM